MNEREKMIEEAIQKMTQEVFGENVNVEIKMIEKEKEKEKEDMPDFSPEINETKRLLKEEKFGKRIVASSKALLQTMKTVQDREEGISPNILSGLLTATLVSLEKEGIIKIIREKE